SGRDSPQFASFSFQQGDKKWSAEKGRNDADRNLGGRDDCPRGGIAEHQECGTEEERSRNEDAVVRTGDEADGVGHDQPDKADGSAKSGDGARQDRTDEISNIFHTTYVNATRR